MLLSGDDADAKQIVSSVIVDSGFSPLDIGGSADTVLHDPGSPLWNNPPPEARAALEELRNNRHTKAGPIAEAVKSLPERAHNDRRWWLEQITKAVFRAGISSRVVDAKWAGFRADFHQFDPGAALLK